jgi:hypothetical protein
MDSRINNIRNRIQLKLQENDLKLAQSRSPLRGATNWKTQTMTPNKATTYLDEEAPRYPMNIDMLGRSATKFNFDEPLLRRNPYEKSPIE